MVKPFKYMPQFVQPLWEVGDSDCGKRPPNRLFVFPLGSPESQSCVPMASFNLSPAQSFILFSSPHLPAKWEWVKLQMLSSKSRDKMWITSCYKSNSGCFTPIQSTNDYLLFFLFFLFFKVFSIWNWQVEWSCSQRYIFLEKFQHNWTMSILQTRHSKPLGVSFFFILNALWYFL